MYWPMYFEININILAVVHSKTTMMQYIGTSAEQKSKILQNSKTSAKKNNNDAEQQPLRRTKQQNCTEQQN